MKFRRGNGASRAADAADARGSSLRTLYYVAALALAALVPMVLFAGLWFRSELRKSQQDLDAYLVARASALSQRIDAEIRQHFAALQAVAALPSLDEPNLIEFHAQATRMAPAMDWSVLALLDPQTGAAVLSTLRPVGAELRGASPEIVRGIVAGRGSAVETREPDPEGLSPERAILLYVPVTRDGVRHVLAAGLRARVVQDLLAAQITDQRVLATVIDERGQVLARSREPETFIGSPASAPLQGSTGGGSFGLAALSAEGGEADHSAVQRSPLTGWLAVAATDGKQFDQIANRSRWAVAGTGAISLTLAGVLAIFLLYNLMEGRLSEERLAASRALGDLDARLLATTQEALGEQRKAASEREVLLREIYHRVKNNLQIIQSLLRLGARELGPGQREPFEDAIRRIGAMARVHTLIYNSSDLASIDFADYLDGLAGEIADAYRAEDRGIRTVLEVEPMRVSLETAVPLAFIAVELLTNALKHAFPAGRGGTVTLATRREGDTGIFTISDDGVGVPAQAPGRRSLGLTIVTKLVQQIGGTLERPQDGRATFRIAFPLEAPAADGQASAS